MQRRSECSDCNVSSCMLLWKLFVYFHIFIILPCYETKMLTSLGFQLYHNAVLSIIVLERLFSPASLVISVKYHTVARRVNQNYLLYSMCFPRPERCDKSVLSAIISILAGRKWYQRFSYALNSFYIECKYIIY